MANREFFLFQMTLCSHGEAICMRMAGRADPSNPLFPRSSAIALIVSLQWVRVTETKAHCSLQLRAQQSPVSGMQSSFRARAGLGVHSWRDLW